LVCRYTTYTSRDAKSGGEEVGCFEQKINLSNGKTLDVIGIDTQALQVCIFLFDQ